MIMILNNIYNNITIFIYYYIFFFAIVALWQRISNSIKQYLKKTNSTELKLYFIFNIFVLSFINICLTLEYRILCVDINLWKHSFTYCYSKFKPREKLKKICMYMTHLRLTFKQNYEILSFLPHHKSFHCQLSREWMNRKNI